MKTLLIDNYDSYTYNLFQLMAEVNGEEPTVVLNDAPAGTRPDLREFDNVVVSPGPGHPGRPRDFGISATVLAESTVPVLGVCLGHQGIAAAEHGRVAAAPQPRHGHLSRIRHDGEDLFRGLPQDFTAVRYHSLSVREPLPASLKGTAWAEDGVLMGLRHRSRPLWGVQFHPESVLTEFGHRLFLNFRSLTAARPRPVRLAKSRVPRPRPENTANTVFVPRPRRPAPAGYRLHTRRIAAAVDAETAFTRMCANAPRAFWLDSARVEEGQSRFSFFGDGAGPLAEFVRYDVDSGVCEIERAGRPVRKVRASVFDYLKRQLATRRVDAGELPFDFTGGYVGYFGYELKADCGASNRHRADTPDACWLFADRLVAVDHRDGFTYAVCLAENTPKGTREATDWLDGAVAQLSFVSSPEPAPTPPSAAEPDLRAAEPWLIRDRATYLADIEACRRELEAGTSYEICLTNAAELPAPPDPLAYYRVLRRINPAPYAAYLKFGDLAVAGASPERFLRITRDGVAEAKPIKGTAPRDGRPEEDARLRDSLAADPKTRAENLMIVDLLRNDLGRVCETATVRVPRLMATETYATVHQLVSTVEGRLREGVDAVDCVRACFPGGSMTGAPKLRTMEIIDTLETEARGVYSGAVGYLGCSGGADLNIVIRTAVLTDGRMRLGAGGAIVLGSDSEAEYDEMLLKTAAQLRAHREATATAPRSLPEQVR
ncbi:aminodeoxychorismate synthase component I [Streptomyces sp. Qhu-G9]|uniref:aminodeoxychorismate synthase component I n=1 Tax=Streptomyces sp. Qhu-G9 TaxID=3452799 RepID=UPI0022AC54A0|nr:aminodeoxychorismate synthase component I [Streptomyces aurantiacus]WAU81767.1 aminodeoxychorismate synthase component I [Streptomyces aurantiacus]